MLNFLACKSFKEPSNKRHPFATGMAFGPCQLPANQAARSFRFYPPHCYQASQAGTSSLLRNHLPPHIASVGLELPLEPSYPCNGNNIRLPRLRRIPCEQSHPQAHYGTDQVSGFALFRTLTLPQRRIRFACAMYCSPEVSAYLLSLPSDPAVASNALTIRIVFPMIGVTPA